MLRRLQLRLTTLGIKLRLLMAIPRRLALLEDLHLELLATVYRLAALRSETPGSTFTDFKTGLFADNTTGFVSSGPALAPVPTGSPTLKPAEGFSTPSAAPFCKVHLYDQQQSVTDCLHTYDGNAILLRCINCGHTEYISKFQVHLDSGKLPSHWQAVVGATSVEPVVG